MFVATAGMFRETTIMFVVATGMFRETTIMFVVATGMFRETTVMFVVTAVAQIAGGHASRDARVSPRRACNDGQILSARPARAVIG